MDLKHLCNRLGYQFRQPALLRKALTHRSYGVPHNERLEFLGDSVLSLAISTKLFQDFPQLSEGELSRSRAHFVREQTLHDIAINLELGKYLLLGEGELKSGGAQRPSILADALEATMGAVYLDSGFAEAERVIHALYQPLFAQLDPRHVGKDPKTQLQELLQSKRISLPQYVIVKTTGEAHDQRFRVECRIPDLSIITAGEGTSKRNAEQEAARFAFDLASKKFPD